MIPRSHIVLLATLLLATPALAQTSMPMPSLGGPFNGDLRGYWFEAPSDFVITSLFVPGTSSNGAQNIQVLLMNNGAAPPAYSGSTTNYTSLFMTTNDSSSGPISVAIPVSTGDFVGILGARGTNGGTMRNAYASSSGTYNSSINGQSVTLTRFIHQGRTMPVGAVSSDATGSIAVVEVTYTQGPPVPLTGGDMSADEGTPLTLAGAVAGNYTSFAWDFGDGTGDTSSLTPSHTWADDGAYTVTLSATNSFGTDTDSATVTVNNLPP